jgi:protein-disulfide isomerase
MDLRKIMPYLVVLQVILLLVVIVQVNGLSKDISSGTVVAGGDDVIVPTAGAADVPAPTAEVNIEGDPWKGVDPSKADVVIVEYSDFECPFCGRAQPTVAALMTKYEGKISLVFKDFPLSFHTNAQISAEAGECADEQGMFWELHDVMFLNQQTLGRDNLIGYAGDVGLDVAEFTTCLDSGDMTAEVTADTSEGSANGVRGTPAFFVNGVLISGAQPQAVFEAEIEKYI